MIPIPFLGWFDDDDTIAMLRKQIHIQQNEIDRLNAEVMRLGVIVGNIKHSVWYIHRKEIND
jgi:hypothetical protein